MERQIRCTSSETIQTAIDRIKQMEECLDVLQQAPPSEIRKDPALRKLLEDLIQYYQGGQWLQDYELDEQGLLPLDLKRGVLAQDAVYDFLDGLDTAL